MLAKRQAPAWHEPKRIVRETDEAARGERSNLTAVSVDPYPRTSPADFVAGFDEQSDLAGSELHWRPFLWLRGLGLRGLHFFGVRVFPRASYFVQG
jgi:hypothetical protein